MSTSSKVPEKQEAPRGVEVPSPAPSLDGVYIPQPQLQSTVMEGEAVIVDLSSNAYFTLNKTATIVWEIVERRAPLHEAVALLSAHFDVPEDVARVDVEALARELLVCGLIQKTG